MPKSFLLSILLLISMPALTEKQEFILATGEWAPFTGKNLPNGGMLVEIVETALNNTKLKYRIVYLPWKRGYKNLLDGDIEGAFPWMLTAERERLFSVSDSIYKSKERFFASKDFTINYQKYEDFKGLSVCLPLGWTKAPIKEFLDNKILSLYQPKNEEDCFQGIILKRTHLYSANSLSGWEAIKRAGLNPADFKEIGPVIRENTFVLLASSLKDNNNRLIQEFNRGMRIIKNNNAYNEIVKKHLELVLK
ncbi:substrate-binding periplasmic protein [Spartinivicinus poritis]|uniref:Transporter substrate-binding domain-containing protein n=1 Tax=Spartinivicinus poritis TaxID=2994640 RepID=A0ABT5UDM4_9GAMM|nr:transporter substrate-binding domain-containing protein [Spartinivicinus sp. A2-2]MDE1463617.1 transporter substrate-binding domain-containing protein [Spartinivicinus sp. A2-2]